MLEQKIEEESALITVLHQQLLVLEADVRHAQSMFRVYYTFLLNPVLTHLSVPSVAMNSLA